jgi:hypothetical protein
VAEMSSLFDTVVTPPYWDLCQGTSCTSGEK